MSCSSYALKLPVLCCRLY